MALHGNARFWLGSYTADNNGTGVGIGLLRQEESGTLQLITSTEAPSPSWVTLHPTLRVLYAVLEFSGMVQAFAMDGEHGLRPLGHPIEAGKTVCHLTVTPDRTALIATCHGDGQVLTYALAPNGSIASTAVPAAASIDPYGSDVGMTAEDAESFGENPFADLAVKDALAEGVEPRQSRAHTSLVLPGGRVVTTDLGHDTVRFWSRSGTRLSQLGVVTLPEGVGPRHVALHPSGYLYVVTEYSNEIFVLREAADASWRVAAAVIATADTVESGDTAAEISLAATQEHVHVGIRGSNRISTVRISGDGSVLTPIGDVDSGGNRPRHHLEDGDLLHVAHQLSGDVTTLRINERGIPQTRVGTVETGTATCLVREPLDD